MSFDFEAAGRLLDRVTDGCWIWDLTGDRSYEYMSPKFWLTLGYDPEIMPHSPSAWQSIIHPVDADRAIDLFHDHMNHGTPYQILVRFQHAAGFWIWILCRGEIELDANGEPVRMYGTHQDVSDIAADQERQLRDEAGTGGDVLERMESVLRLLA